MNEVVNYKSFRGRPPVVIKKTRDNERETCKIFLLWRR